MLLGLIIFNSVLIIFSGYFVYMPTDPSGPYGAIDVSGDPDIAKYGEVGSIGSFLGALFSSGETLWIIGIIIVGSGFIGYFTGGAKNLPLALGIGLFLSMVVALFNTTKNVFFQIPPAGVVSSLTAVIFIGIGLLTVWTVGEMLLGSRGVDA